MNKYERRSKNSYNKKAENNDSTLKAPICGYGFDMTVCAAYHHFPEVDKFAKEAGRVIGKDIIISGMVKLEAA